MITFIISLIALVIGFVLYGTFVERVFGIDPKAQTPALTKTDGVDFVPMKPWRIFLVQFLNIAGLGPIFGAIMGIFYGPSAFLWIVLGTIFAGGVHDYLQRYDFTSQGRRIATRSGGHGIGQGRANLYATALDRLARIADYDFPVWTCNVVARVGRVRQHDFPWAFDPYCVGIDYLWLLHTSNGATCR